MRLGACGYKPWMLSLQPTRFQSGGQVTATRRCPCRPCCSSSAGKGFGSPQADRAKDEGEGAKGKGRRGKRVALRREEAPIPGQGQQQQQAGLPFGAGVSQLEQKLVSEKEDEDFAQRLAVLRQEGSAEARRLSQQASAAPAALPRGAIFDAPVASTSSRVDIYANPPSIGDTLLSQLNSDVSDPKLKSAQIGPNQVGIAVSAVVFGLVFVLVSGSDFAPSRRYESVRPATQPPDELQASLLKGRIAQLENARAANPSDAEALEALAVTYAQLFEFEKAAGLLDQLTAARPRDGEAWRLLGETALLSQQPARAAAAYEKAAALGDGSSDLQVLTGLTDAYIASAEQAKAVSFLTKLKQQASAAAVAFAAPAEQATAGGAAAPSADGGAAAEAGAAAMASAPAAPAPAPPVDTVSLDLLLAKVYNRWRGHDADALATYDAVIAAAPKDFRGYLAKGVFLKDRGQKAESQRMFQEARFYAPLSRQGFIDAMAGANPVLDVAGPDG